MFPNSVECGSWKIPFADVERAIVFRTRQWFIPVKVLQLVTSERTYQFGFNPWANPFRHLRILLTEQKVRLTYSAFSIAVRLALVAAIVWMVLN